FAATSVIFVVTSLASPPPDPSRVARYCWKSPLAVIAEKPLEGMGDPRVIAALLVAAMVACYVIFA
ncbi:MAG TPA: sodium:glucose symporter, partial [Planctomycetes bacterium]|nr:sodium:glucose symporter [Planctomycetota bacterium]